MRKLLRFGCFLLILALYLLFTSKMWTKSTPQLPPWPEPATINWDNGQLRLELIDPQEPGQPGSTGCRFLRAGWIRGLYLNNSEQSIFRRFSWHPRLPLYGFAWGFFPSLQLSADTMAAKTRNLCLGVGIVEITGGEHFEAAIIEYFPWQREVSQDQTAITLIARQKSPIRADYAYDLTVVTHLPKNAAQIEYEITLTNTGKQRIDSELFAHPFFNAVEGFASSWFTLPDQPERQLVADAPKQIELSSNEFLTTKSLSAGNFYNNDDWLEISSNNQFSRAVFWKNSNNCYAVEPFWQVSLAPGETMQQQCILQFNSLRK